jgi:hypothetical protein
MRHGRGRAIIRLPSSCVRIVAEWSAPVAQDMMEAGAILLGLAFVLGILHGWLATAEQRPWWARWLPWWRSH